MKFSIGDHVRVITDRWDNEDFIQGGRDGVIVRMDGPVGGAVWMVYDGLHPDEFQGPWFQYPADIVLVRECQCMQEAEFTLDEIIQSQDLVNGG